jgi:hypothetical protein
MHTINEKERIRLRAIRDAIVRVHDRLRDSIVTRCQELSLDELARTAATDGAGDETFVIDVAAEALLAQALAAELAPLNISMGVLFEGQREPLVIPQATNLEDAEYLSLWDPLDGSRLLAYQLHSGWILTAVAPNRGADTRLSDAVIAVQSEVPTLSQRTAARIVAVGNLSQPASIKLVAESLDLATGVVHPLRLKPSQATSLAKGFVANECYFEGPATLLTQIEEQVLARVLGPASASGANVWRDTQLTSAGTLFNMYTGKVRWAHDLRPLTKQSLEKLGIALTLCAHPYDLCTAPLLCAGLGIVLEDPRGGSFDAPLSVDDNVAWSAYASRTLASQIAPALRDVLMLGGYC